MEHTITRVSVEAGGPFKDHFELILRDGITLLEGPNGAGKSWLMRLIKIFSDQHELEIGDLTVNDEMTGAEATATVGETVIRAKQGKTPIRTDAGETLPPIQELPDEIKTLISGDNLKGEFEAFQHRLNALLDFIGMRTTVTMQAKLAGDTKPGKECATGVFEDRITDWVAKWRKAMMKIRKELKDKLEEANRELATVQGRISGVCDDNESLEQEARAAIAGKLDLSDAQAAHDEASQTYHGLKATAEERVKQRAQLQELLGSSEASSRLDEAREWRERLEKLEAQAKAVEEERAQAERDRVALENQIEAAKAAEHECTKRADEISDQVDECRKAMTKIAERNAELEQARADLGEGGIELIPESDLEEANAKLLAAQQRRKLAETVRSMAAMLEAESSVYEKIETLTNGHAEVDKELKDVWKRMATAVNEQLESDQGEKPIIFVDIDQTPRGKVLYHLMTRDHDGVERHFTDDDYISEGMRVEACIRTMLLHLAGPRIVVMPGAVTISPKRRDLLGELAKQRRIKLVMESPEEVTDTTDRIRATHHPAAS